MVIFTKTMYRIIQFWAQRWSLIKNKIDTCQVFLETKFGFKSYTYTHSHTYCLFPISEGRQLQIAKQRKIQKKTKKRKKRIYHLLAIVKRMCSSSKRALLLVLFDCDTHAVVNIWVYGSSGVWRVLIFNFLALYQCISLLMSNRRDDEKNISDAT